MFDSKIKYDIAISGAGVAGIAAALAAARRGHKVVLIEKQMLIGGLATSGLIYIYLPLCDGNGTQVTFGISEELLRASLEFSPFDLPEKWGGKPDGRVFGDSRFRCDFSPAGMVLSLDDLLKKAGVDLWLDSRVCSVQKASDGKITGLEVENCSGRILVEAGYFVDTTGDATVIRRAGGETQTDENRHTLWMMQRNPDAKSRYYFTDSTHIIPFGSALPYQMVEGDARTGKVTSQFIRTSWDTARNYYRDSYSSQKTNRYNHYPLHLPAMAQFRKIACITGVETLTTNSQWQHFDSSIGLYADWRCAGKVYETPYGSLIPKDVRGIYAAGRCMSATGDAWESYRVIPSAAMTGEAAGIGAALCVEKNCDAIELTLDDLRNELRKNNFKFFFEEVGLNPKEYQK